MPSVTEIVHVAHAGAKRSNEGTGHVKGRPQLRSWGRPVIVDRRLGCRQYVTVITAEQTSVDPVSHTWYERVPPPLPISSTNVPSPSPVATTVAPTNTSTAVE